MEKKPLIILGSSGHAKVIIDIVEKQNEYKIIGLIDAFKSIGENTLGYDVIGAEEDIISLSTRYNHLHIFIAIGDNAKRLSVVEKLKTLCVLSRYATVIHPSAQIGKDVFIGKGVAVMAGSVVNSSTSVGDFTIINTKASVDHDCKIGEFVSIAPGATLGGGVSVGNLGVVSIGASVKHGIAIGENSIIGAGAVLLNDVGDNEVHIGVPAKFHKKRSIGEKYL